MNSFLSRLGAAVDSEWTHIKQGRFWHHVMNERVDPLLYKGLMEQIYHYTRQNSVNQAAAAYRTAPERRRLLRFVYRHALEELGHESMVVHDLTSINLYDVNLERKRPLPPTQALIAYLGAIAIEKGAAPRLGYTYWAETCYRHIDPILKKFATDLQLSEQNMTFFIAHSEIDAKHAAEVNETIDGCVTEPEEMDELVEVATTTLYLTGQILEAVERDYWDHLAPRKVPVTTAP